MEYTIEQIDAPEDDFILKIDRTIFFMSEREFEALAQGLQRGYIKKQFRVGEEVCVEIETTENRVSILIQSGYNSEWSSIIPLRDYYEFTRSISSACGEEISVLETAISTRS